MKALTRRILALEKKIHLSRTENTWRGIRISALIDVMTKEERDSLRQTLLKLPEIPQHTDEYIKLESYGATVFNAAYRRINSDI